MTQMVRPMGRPVGSLVLISLAVLLLLGCHSLRAADLQSQVPYSPGEFGKFLKPTVGTQLVPRGNVEAWEHYPSGLFFGRGDKIAEIEPGQEYVVVGNKVIVNFVGGDDYFIKVLPQGANLSGTEPCSVGCWVYQGKAGSSVAESLLPKNYVVEDIAESDWTGPDK